MPVTNEPAASPQQFTESLGRLADVVIPREKIAQLAYSFYVERGGQHGHAIEDWCRAERELRARALAN